MAERIAQTVRTYLERVAAGQAAQIAELYAPDGTLEDPVGTEPKRGHAQITEFYGALSGLDISTELLTLRIAGDTAAFHFRVTTRHAGGASVIEPIDVMTFDDAGLITSMRAVWGPADVRNEPKE